MGRTGILIFFQSFLAWTWYIFSCFLQFSQYFRSLIYVDPKLPVVQLLICVWHFVIPWTGARQAPLCFTVSWSLPKLMCIKSAMPSNHLILCHPLLPSGSFPMSQLTGKQQQQTFYLVLLRVIPWYMFVILWIRSFLYQQIPVNDYH